MFTIGWMPSAGAEGERLPLNFLRRSPTRHALRTSSNHHRDGPIPSSVSKRSRAALATRCCSSENTQVTTTEALRTKDISIGV